MTGSTLNGRKDYLKAEEADKEKWDFLNFAQAWTPSDSVTGDAEDVFFSHVRLNLVPQCAFTRSDIIAYRSNTFSSVDGKNKEARCTATLDRVNNNC